MEKKSFGTLARRFFGKQQNGSDKRRKTMKLLKNLVMLATLGMSATVHADGWMTIPSSYVQSISSDPDDKATILMLKEKTPDGRPLNNGCNGTLRYFVIFTDDPRHDQVYTMLMTALLAERKFEVFVRCEGSNGGGRFGQIVLY